MHSRGKSSAIRWAWLAACLAAPGVLAQSVIHTGEAGGSLFERDETIILELRGPFRTLLADRHGEPAYHDGELRYSSDGAEVTLPVEIRTRGKTRRSRDICGFPPLRVRFPADSADEVFAGQKTLKLVTHCRDRDSYDQYVLQEYLAYRSYNLLTERSHRVRLARLTYVEPAGRVLTTRYGIFLEDWREVAARNGLEAIDAEGAINIDKLSGSDANRVAVFQYMIGNQDWSMLWPEPRENCCHNTKPLLATDGTVVPLPYDFDFSGIVNAPYALGKTGSDDVRRRRYAGLCATQDGLASTVKLFQDKREAVYGLHRDQPGVSSKRLHSSLKYLDGFYRVIDDPDQVESRMIRRCKKK
jgi:hypothetical protein